MGWSPRLQTGFHVSRPTLVPNRRLRLYVYVTFTLYGLPFQVVRLKLAFTAQARTPDLRPV